MQELLLADCHAFLYLDNPEILLKDAPVYYPHGSLNKKVKKTCGKIRKMIISGLSPEEIIDHSVELITAELRPSRFGYVCALIASEFPKTFLSWVKTNALTDQVLDVVNACEPVFSLLKFNARTAEQHSIYVTVTNFIRHYLKRKRAQSALRPLSSEIKKPSEYSSEMAPDARLLKAGSDACRQELLKPQTVFTPQPSVTAAPAASTGDFSQPAPLKRTVRAQGTLEYFNSELLEKSATSQHSEPASYRILTAITEPQQQIQTMSSKQYQINKGINKSLVFKGLKAQYIGYMGIGLLIDLIFYALLYLFKINTYVTLFLTLTLGVMLAAFVYHLNASYGEHGLIKALAKRKTPRIIRSFSRRIFR